MDVFEHNDVSAQSELVFIRHATDWPNGFPGDFRRVAEKMVKAGLSPKTVNTYSQVVKSVVASAVNEEGEQLFPRKWNHEFVDMPAVARDLRFHPNPPCCT